LDLSSVLSLDDSWAYAAGSEAHTITATAGGTIDLSNVLSVTGPYYGNDQLEFRWDGTSTIDITPQTCSANVVFVPPSGGTPAAAAAGRANQPGGIG